MVISLRPKQVIGAIEDPLEKYRREQLELEARRRRAQAQTASELNAERTRDWERWLHGHLEVERKLMIEAIGTGVGEIRAKLREQLRAEFRHELAETVKELRREISVAKAHSDGSLVDLAAPVIRKVKDNAA